MSTAEFPPVPEPCPPSHPSSQSWAVDFPKPVLVYNMDELLIIMENALRGRIIWLDPEAKSAANQADLPGGLRTLDPMYGLCTISLYWDRKDLETVLRDGHSKLHQFLIEKITRFHNRMQSAVDRRGGRQSLVCERLQKRVTQGDARPYPFFSALNSYPPDLRSKYIAHFKPLFDCLFNRSLDKYFDPVLDPRPPLAIMAGFTEKDLYGNPEGADPMNNAHASSSANHSTAVVNQADTMTLLLARIKELEMEQSGALIRESISLSKWKMTSNQSKLQKAEAATAEPKAKQIGNKTSTHELIQLVMKAADRRGFTVSANYAELFLGRNNNQIIGAIDAMEADLERREQALVATGRVPYHRRRLEGRGPEPRDGFTRDEAIRFLEDDDRRLQAYEEHGMNSFMGYHTMGIKPHLLATFRAYNLEVAYRNERSQLYKSMADGVANGSTTAEEMSKALDDFDMGKTVPAYMAPDSGIQDGAQVEAGYTFERFIDNYFPEIAACDKFQRGEQAPAAHVDRASSISEGETEAEAEAEAENSDAPKMTKAELLKELEEVCELTNELAEKQTKTTSAAAAAAAAAVEMTLPDEFPFQEDIASMSKERQADELTRLANFMESLKVKAAADVPARRR